MFEGIDIGRVNIAQEYIVVQLRKELEKSEATEVLIDWLLDAWQTLEILQDRFGEARAMQIFTASARFPQASAEGGTVETCYFTCLERNEEEEGETDVLRALWQRLAKTKIRKERSVTSASKHKGRIEASGN